MSSYSPDRKYQRFIKKKHTAKLIDVLKLLICGKKTRTAIENETGFSHGTINDLIAEAKDMGYVTEKLVGTTKRYVKYNSTKKPGEKGFIHGLTIMGWLFIANDPKVKNRQVEFEKAYDLTVDCSYFDSDEKFLKAIEEHPLLKRFDKTNYFMNDVLSQTTLNPFLYVNPRSEDVELFYDDLVEVMGDNVKSEHILSYYQTLDENRLELKKVLRRHSLLLKKMEELEEVKKYLDTKEKQ